MDHKRQTMENDKRKQKSSKKTKKEKIKALNALCTCKPHIKTVSNSGAKVKLCVCVHMLEKFGLYAGDRIRHSDRGDGFVLGVGIVENREKLFIKFDWEQGCKFSGVKAREKIEVLFRPDYDHNRNINLFHTETANLLASTRTSNRFSDITLVCGTKKFECHKVLLCAASPVFSAMFNTDAFVENKKREVELRDDPPEILDILLSFIYGIYHELTGDNVMATYEIAKKYGIDLVINAIHEKIYDLLTDDSVFDAIRIFLKDSNRKCFRACFGYISNNYNRLKGDPRLLQMKIGEHPFLMEFWKELTELTTVISSDQ